MPATAVSRAHDVADQLFERHAGVFGDDLPTYSGHVHRVIGLVGLQCEVDGAVAGPLGLAAFFHDAAIWFDHTWDYLAPSADRAVAELDPTERTHAELVGSLITEHHRIRPARHASALVEAFRRADLTDVTASLIRCPGVSRAQYRQLVDRHPAKGFRPMLLGAFGRGLRQSPLHPIPMIKF